MDAPIRVYLAQTVCSWPGCNDPFYAKGYCHTHYYREKRGFDMGAPVKSIKSRHNPRARRRPIAPLKVQPGKVYSCADCAHARIEGEVASCEFGYWENVTKEQLFNASTKEIQEGHYCADLFIIKREDSPSQSR